MLARRSVLNVADNSGAKNLVIIGIGKGTGKRFAKLGDKVSCAVRGASASGQVKDHEIVKAIIVRCRKETRRVDGTYVRFSDNAAVIIDDAGIPKATRIFGPVATELRDRGYSKIISMAQEVV